MAARLDSLEAMRIARGLHALVPLGAFCIDIFVSHLIDAEMWGRWSEEEGRVGVCV